MATLVSAALTPSVAAAPDRWGIGVVLEPAVAKAGLTEDFTVTLTNSGNLTVTVCQIDIHFIWNDNPQTVFEGSQNIAPFGGNRSWTVEEAIPPSVTPGTYRATINVTALTLIEPRCTSNDWIHSIEIVPNLPPRAAFSFDPPSPPPNTIVHFTDASTDADGAIVAWHWDFGDGQNSSQRNPVHAFGDAGVYDVVLVVRDDSDGSDVDSKTVQVEPNLVPIAGFSYAPQSANTLTPIQFSDGSSDADGTILAWHWDFGDGQDSSQRNPVHRFPAAGIYPVTLTVTDDRGASNSFTQTVPIALASVPGGTTATGFGVLEWGFVGAIVASTSLVAAFVVWRKVSPSRRWGQAQNSPRSEEPKRKRWRPR